MLRPLASLALSAAAAHPVHAMGFDLLPRELDKLQTIYLAGSLAQKRLARGLRLNTAEATSLIALVLHELIRDGNHSVAELMAIGECCSWPCPLPPSQAGGVDSLECSKWGAAFDRFNCSCQSVPGTVAGIHLLKTTLPMPVPHFRAYRGHNGRRISLSRRANRDRLSRGSRLDPVSQTSRSPPDRPRTRRELTRNINRNVGDVQARRSWVECTYSP